MKLSFSIFVLILTIIYTLPSPPRANDLSDHFGTNPSANKYGPTQSFLPGGQLARRGVGPNTSITPITNFDFEINPYDVTSGDLDNASPEASKIIKPIYAGKIKKKLILRTNNENRINN